MNLNDQEEKFGESEANGPVSTNKLKEYGMKAYHPILNVVHKYQGEFSPYFAALVKGLQGGVGALTNESASEQEKYVGQFFKEAADNISQVSEKLKGQDLSSIMSYMEEQATKRPSVMFSTSYLAGLFFGRIGRHIGRSRSKSSSSTTENTSESTFSTQDPNRETFGDNDFNIGQQSIH